MLDYASMHDIKTSPTPSQYHTLALDSHNTHRYSANVNINCQSVDTGCLTLQALQRTQ